MDILKRDFTFSAVLIGLSAIAATGCGNSSNSMETHNQSLVSSQAIDGYIVNGAVFCDDERNGRTEAAGRFNCPASTSVALVRGGMDVGFDETAISGGMPFVGELKAPGGAPFVTPLSTIATNMATTAGAFDAAQYNGAVANLAVSLNLTGLDLSVSPVVNVEMAKANAKINQLITNFADSASEYSVVSEQLANALKATVPINLTAEASTIVSTLNEVLAFAAPELSVEPAEQAKIVEAYEQVTNAIDQSVSAKQIGDVVESENGSSPYVFAIDRSAPLVRFGDSTDQSAQFFSLAEFEGSSLGSNGYKVVNGSQSKVVEFSSSAFDINQSVTDVDVSLAIEFTSTDLNDERHISIIMDGANLSMTEGSSDSIKISVPSNTLLFAQAKDEVGVVTNITTLAGDDYFATNANGNFMFAFSSLNDELNDRGYYNFTQESGNYEVTMVISGLGFGIKESAISTSAPGIYTISTATRSVTGNGLNGYFTTH